MNNLTEAVRSYVIAFLSENLSGQLLFHNIHHTYEVVAAVHEIGLQCGLSQEEMNMLEIAAWFHDCGYANAYMGHEEESKKIAEHFLESFGCGKTMIESVLNCIESTKYPQNPSSLAEKVICDADMYHLTRPGYQEYEKAIRQEFEKYLGLVYTDEEWRIKNSAFLTCHSYFTEYGQKILTKFKEVNIQLINQE